MKLSRSAVGLAAVWCAFMACGRQAADDATAADDAFSGLHIRAVWLQDVGDGADFEAQGERLRVMGFDSRDHRGEFAVLSQRANYARPLITRRGDRVVFSSRRTGKVSIVRWDGSGRREITDGLGVAAWIDPSTDEEWVYLARPGANTDSTGWPMGNIWRHPIDRPGPAELVWDRTDIDVDNFQVSADGTRACGLFPWPSGGMAELPNGPWVKYDEGCWTSLSPDNSYRSWVFDGNHRDLSVFDAGGTNKRIIGLGALPEMHNCEVRHPRWGNHPRYVAFTGPYCAAEGDGQAASGHAVEAYVARFNEDFTGLDEVWRLTRNRRADFFPDLWIEPSPHDREASVPGARPEPISPRSQGAGADEGLVFVWENRSAPNIVTRGGDYVRTCRVMPRGRAWYGRFFDMLLRGGVFEAQDIGRDVADEWRDVGALSIEAVLTPSVCRQAPAATIIAYGPEAGPVQFALRHDGDSLVVVLQTTTPEGPVRSSTAVCAVTDTQPHHLLVSYRAGLMACYRDGRRETETSRIPGGFESWTDGRLVFGDNLQQGTPWSGSLEGIVLLNRFVPEQEAAERAEGRLAAIQGRAGAASWRLDARLVEVTPVPDARTIAPYHRALVVNAYDVIGDSPEGLPRILVAHWAILDRAPLLGVPAGIGSIHRLEVERFEDHPQLESERLLTGVADPTLPLFFEVGAFRASQ